MRLSCILMNPKVYIHTCSMYQGKLVVSISEVHVHCTCIYMYMYTNIPPNLAPNLNMNTLVPKYTTDKLVIKSPSTGISKVRMCVYIYSYSSVFVPSMHIQVSYSNNVNKCVQT